MHRSYRPIGPAQSRLLQQKWDQAYYDEHRRRLASVRPQVDTRPPQTFMHLHLKLKKLQLEEERLAMIERDNRILLEKMSHIMRTSGNINVNNDYERKSLNRQQRLRELLSITRENQHILKRIMSSRPQYDHLQWEREWHTNLQLMDQISAFPPEWWKDQKEQPESSQDNSSQREKSDVDGDGKMKESNRKSVSRHEKKGTKKEETSGAKDKKKSEQEGTVTTETESSSSDSNEQKMKATKSPGQSKSPVRQKSDLSRREKSDVASSRNAQQPVKKQTSKNEKKTNDGLKNEENDKKKEEKEMNED